MFTELIIHCLCVFKNEFKIMNLKEKEGEYVEFIIFVEFITRHLL